MAKAKEAWVNERADGSWSGCHRSLGQAVASAARYFRSTGCKQIHFREVLDGDKVEVMTKAFDSHHGTITGAAVHPKTFLEARVEVVEKEVEALRSQVKGLQSSMKQLIDDCYFKRSSNDS